MPGSQDFHSHSHVPKLYADRKSFTHILLSSILRLGCGFTIVVRSSTRPLPSESEPQGKLHLTVRPLRARDCSCSSNANRGIRQPELWMIEPVKEFRAELQLSSFPRIETSSRSRNRSYKAQGRLEISSQSAPSERGRCCKCGWIKPEIDALVRRIGIRSSDRIGAARRRPCSTGSLPL